MMMRSEEIFNQGGFGPICGNCLCIITLSKKSKISVKKLRGINYILKGIIDISDINSGHGHTCVAFKNTGRKMSVENLGKNLISLLFLSMPLL